MVTIIIDNSKLLISLILYIYEKLNEKEINNKKMIIILNR